MNVSNERMRSGSYFLPMLEEGQARCRTVHPNYDHFFCTREIGHSGNHMYKTPFVAAPWGKK